MVKNRHTDFCEELTVLQTPKIQEELGNQLKTLYDLGVECYEIEILIDLKINEVVV